MLEGQATILAFMIRSLPVLFERRVTGRSGGVFCALPQLVVPSVELHEGSGGVLCALPQSTKVALGIWQG
jgi:hypothetical protein